MTYGYLNVNNMACIRGLFPDFINYTHCQSRAKCQANNVNLGRNYKTKHAESCMGNCGNFESVDNGEVERIIFDCVVPLASMSYGSTKLKVITAEAWTNYIAVSHVLSGGLGNPTAMQYLHVKFESWGNIFVINKRGVTILFSLEESLTSRLWCAQADSTFEFLDGHSVYPGLRHCLVCNLNASAVRRCSQ